VTADRSARYAAVVAMRGRAQFEDALHAIEALIADGLDAPEAATLRAHLLGDMGRYQEAVSGYRAVIARAPAMIDAQETLAQLLPQIGFRDAALDGYHAALECEPENGLLWLSALGIAKGAGEHVQLLRWCDAVERRFGPDMLVMTLRAQALSALGEDRAALAVVEQALAIESRHQPLHTTLAHIALRIGDAERAKRAAMQGAQLDPDDQSAWALLTVALRLLDDPREFWLADYEAHVVTVPLAGLDMPPVARHLATLHMTRDHPADQSLRGGTQTRGNLFDRPSPEIAGLRSAIAEAVAGSIGKWGYDPKHPFLRRNTGRVAFAASWSVSLRSGGHHVSHIHPRGWLSSACYIALPRTVGSSDAGALAFGIPDAALNVDLPPRRIVRPREAMLVLFPSFMWHGTVAFQDDTPRLTVAFDAVPA
jgi:tetratricopeptide (TPR) repeat protein